MMDPELYGKRLTQLQEVIRSRALDAVLVGAGPELEWLTGYAATGLERLTLLVVRAASRATIILPRLEAPAAMAAAGMSSGAVELVTWLETEDPFALVPALVSSGRGAGPERVLVSDGMHAAFVLRLQDVLPGVGFDIASGAISPLRSIKETEEIELLRAAAAAADRVIAGLFAGTLVGRTEADIAAEVRERLVGEGHDVAMFSIVASGPNSASPHHQPGERVVAAGEPLLFDIGGRRAGYCSDITRTVWISGPSGDGPDETFREIYDLVQRAQATARQAVRPGVTFESLDRAARDVIESAGHGEHFFHRLGHGIGLEVHEDPYLVEGNTDTVAAGTTFSVEPGIYLEGRYGVRIEDQVACTPDGVDTLNQAPRELLEVAGV